MLHKTLFITPPWVKTAGRVLTCLVMLAAIGGAMICTWGYRKDFDLIPAKTGIPAWLVILEIHLFAVMSLHSAISVLLARKEATFLGISFGGMSFLAAPGTLGGPRGEEIAQGYPNIFGLTTLILCFLIWAFFFERKKAKEAA